MAVNINVLSQFDSKGIDRARADLDKLADQTRSTSQKMMQGAQIAGAAMLAGGVAIGAALYGLGEQFDAAFDNIRIGTGATGDALEGLKGDMKKIASEVPTSFANAGTAVTELNKRLGLSGEPLQQMSEQVLELSRLTKTDLQGNIAAVSQVMQNFGVSTGDQSGKLDLLFRASQKSGVSVADLASQMSGAGVVLRDLGLGFDQSAALLATLGKAGIDTGDVMPALSKSLAVAAKQGKDASTVFSDAFSSIKNAPNDVVASGVALETFGAKAGPKLAAMIREGKLSYEEMAAALGNGDSILQAGKDTEDFGEKLTRLKNRVFLAIEPIATKVFNAIGDAMDKIGPKIEQVTKWLTEHSDVLKVIAGVVGAAILVFLAAYTASMISAAAATIAATWPILAVVAAIGLLIAGVVYAWNNWDWFRDAVTAAWEAIKKAAIYAWENVLKPIWNAIVWYVQNLLIPYYTMLWNVAKAVFEKIAAIVSWAWDNVIQPTWTAISWYIENVLVPWFTIVWDVVKSVWEKVSAKVSDAWNNVLQPIWNTISNYVQYILIPILSALWDTAQTVWNNVSTIISVAWDGYISPAFNNIKSGIALLITVFSSIKDGVVNAFNGIFDLIVEPVRGAINWIIDKWNGIKFKTPNVPGTDIGGMTIGVPQIPRLHSGGIFQSNSSYGEGLALLQDGEMVLTTRQQQNLIGNGPSVNVVINTVAGDPAAIERVVVDAIGRAHLRGLTALKP